jgi:hypothetical protein
MKIHKVVCINAKVGKPYLTYGKVYDHIDYDEGITSFIDIIDDTGRESGYRNDYFITLEEWREKQLNEIGL